jgi:hypothetical protein
MRPEAGAPGAGGEGGDAGCIATAPSCPVMAELARDTEVPSGRPGEPSYLRFTTSGPGVVDISAEPSGAFSIGLELLDERLNAFPVRAQSPAAGAPASLSLLLPPAAYLLRLARSGQVPGAATYRVKVALDTSDPFELNETFATAAMLTLGMEASAKLRPAGDVDIFKVVVDKAGTLEATVDPPPPGVDVRIDLLDDKQAVWGAPGMGVAGRPASLVAPVTPGTYFVRVSALTSGMQRESTTAYALKVTVDASDTFEPNNAFNQAGDLPVDKVVMGTIRPAGDTDYFKVTIDKAGEYDILIDPAPSSLEVVLELFDDQQMRLGGAMGNVGQTVTYAVALKPGSYFVRVRDSMAGRSSNSAYGLRVRPRTSDPFEPNNTFADAGSLELGKSVMATLRPAGDVDYFKIVVDKQGVLDVAADPVPSTLEVRAELFDAKQTAVAQGGGPLGQPVILAAAVAPGTYYLRVRDNVATRSSETPYTLKVSLDTSDPLEPNNTFSEASEIKLGQDVLAKIRPVGDVDVYRFTTTAPGVVDLLVDPVPPNLDMRAELLDDKQALVAQAAGLGGQPVFVSVSVKPGTFFVRLRESAPAPTKMSTAAYKLRVTLDTSDPLEVNDTFADASPLMLGREVTAKIRPIGDVDTYKLTTTAPGLITIEVNPVPAEIELLVQLFDEKQLMMPLTQQSGGPGQAVYLYLARRPGSFYLRALDRRSASRASDTPYKIKASLDTSDAFEPNNTLLDSAPITLGTEVSGKIWPEGDVDHYQFVAAAGSITVVVDPVPATLGVAITIYNAQQMPLYGATAMTRGQAVMFTSPAMTAGGTFYLAVRAQGASSESYRVRVTQ